MRIEIKKARGYGYISYPQSSKTNQQIQAYLRSYGVKWEGVYLQELSDVEAALEGTVSDRVKRQVLTDLGNGWQVTVNIEDWTYLQGWVGYDAGDNHLQPRS